VTLLAETWNCATSKNLTAQEFTLNNKKYAEKYDETQIAVDELSGLDDLLAGLQVSYIICTYICNMQL